MDELINSLCFDDKGLIPAVVQNKDTKEVLMVAYMNKESLELTIKTGRATFWSRSRQQLWVKGETSGNLMYVHEIKVDCDQDCQYYRCQSKTVASAFARAGRKLFFRFSQIVFEWYLH